MNFFNSIFADDPDPPTSPTPGRDPDPSESNPDHDDDGSSDHDSNPTTPSSSQVWSFGGLVKTLQVKSDWIDSYRRDLQEFGSGLKKETQVLREVASKAVKDLPTTIDIGASKAQVSLESVGQAIDSIGSSVWKSTAEIIAQGKDTLLAPDYDDSYDASDVNISGGTSNLQSVSSGRYSRFDAMLRGIQCDVNTYVEDPDDVDEYNKWKNEFSLEEKNEEIENLMKENGDIRSNYDKVVNNGVNDNDFWCRYFYRVHRLQEAEIVRARLVKRAISTEDEEELSWDVDDEEEEEVVKTVDGSGDNVSDVSRKEDNGETKEDVPDNGLGNKSSVSDEQKEEVKAEVDGEGKSDVVESAIEQVSYKEVKTEGTSEMKNDELSKKPEENVASEGKAEPSESGKDSDISVVSTQPSVEEDDMGWDEIEDLGSGDEKKVSSSGAANRDELRKRLSTAEEDEDLSWDIEDED